MIVEHIHIHRTLSLWSKREGPRELTKLNKDDSRYRDMLVMCSDLTYAITGIMLKNIWSLSNGGHS